MDDWYRFDVHEAIRDHGRIPCGVLTLKFPCVRVCVYVCKMSMVVQQEYVECIVPLNASSSSAPLVMHVFFSTCLKAEISCMWR